MRKFEMMAAACVGAVLMLYLPMPGALRAYMGVEFRVAPEPFLDDGIVHLVVTNEDSFAAAFYDFWVGWKSWEQRDESGSVRLQRVLYGGDSPQEAEVIWRAPTEDGVGIERVTDSPDPNAYTLVTKEDGIADDPFVYIPSNTTVNVWLDFTGEDFDEDERNFTLSDLDPVYLCYFSPRYDLDDIRGISPADAIMVINQLGSDDPLADFDGDRLVTEVDVQAILDRLGTGENTVSLYTCTPLRFS